MRAAIALLTIGWFVITAQSAALDDKVVQGLPSRVAKGTLTLILDGCGNTRDFEVAKDVPITIDDLPALLEDLDGCGFAQVELGDDGKVKKITAAFVQEGDRAGTIKSVDAASEQLTFRTVVEDQETDLALKVPDKARLYVSGKKVKLADLKPGLQAVVRIKLNDTVVILRAMPAQ